MCFQLIYGRSAAAAAWAKDDVEMAKRLVSILKAGPSDVLFDNLPLGLHLGSHQILPSHLAHLTIARVYELDHPNQEILREKSHWIQHANSKPLKYIRLDVLL